MRCRLVVKVTDVFYSPIDGAKVEVFTSPVLNASASGDQFKLIAARESGVHLTDELDIVEFEVNVSHPSFFAAHQKGRVQPADGAALPNVVFGAKNQLFEQELSSYELTAHSHDGAVPLVELYIALGRLIDVTSDVNGAADVFRAKPSLGKSIGFLTPSNHEIRHFSKDALLAAERSNGPFASEKKILRAIGKSHFALWKPTPDSNIDQRVGRNMVAIYDPSTKFSNRKPRTGRPQNQRINYHIFLHPSTSWFPDPRYPFGSWWIDLVSRYVYGRQQSGVGKAMANQVQSSGKLNTVLIYPVGSGTRWHNDLLTQEGVMRLVHEVGYFIQRRDGERYPLQPVGSVGISAFSSAIAFVSSILRSRAPRLRSGAAIREVFSLDGRVMAGNRVSESGTLEFAALLRSWLLEDMPNRSVRSYNQLRADFDALQNIDPTAKTTIANGCSLVHGASVTALHCPTAAWNFFFTEPFDSRQPLGANNPPTLNQGAFPKHGPDMPVHDIIPAWFLQHALSVAKHD